MLFDCWFFITLVSIPHSCQACYAISGTTVNNSITFPPEAAFEIIWSIWLIPFGMFRKRSVARFRFTPPSLLAPALSFRTPSRTPVT
jgi:hypothetical protein